MGSLEVKRFTTEVIKYHEHIEKKRFFKKPQKLIIPKYRYETNIELMRRVIEWIKDNDITDYKITTVPITADYVNDYSSQNNISFTKIDVFVIYEGEIPI